MEQPKKNMKESNSEDEIKFLTALKPGVTDLRPFLPKHPEAHLNEPWNISKDYELISSISTDFLIYPKESKSLQIHMKRQGSTRYFYLMIHRSECNPITLIVLYGNIYRIIFADVIRYFIDNRCGLIYQTVKPTFENWITVNGYLFNKIVRNCVINKYCEISNINRMSFTLNGTFFENQLENFLYCLLEAPVLFKIEGFAYLTLWINNTKVKQIQTAVDFSSDIINLFELLGSSINVSKRSKKINICTKKLTILKNPISFDVNFFKIIKNKNLKMLSTKTIDTYLIKKVMLSMHNIFKSINTILSNHSLITKDEKLKYSELLSEILNEFFESLNISDEHTSTYMYSINFNICIAKLNILLVLLIHKCLKTRNKNYVNMTYLEGKINSGTSKESYYLPFQNYKLDKLNTYFTISTQTSFHDFHQNENFKTQNLIKKTCQHGIIKNLKKITHNNIHGTVYEYSNLKSHTKIKPNSIRYKELMIHADICPKVSSNQFRITGEETSVINILNRKKRTHLALVNKYSGEVSTKISLASLNEQFYKNEPKFQMVQELSCSINSCLPTLESGNLEDDILQQNLQIERVNEWHKSSKSVNKNKNCNDIDFKTFKNASCDVSGQQLRRSKLIQSVTSFKRTVPEFIQLQFKPPKFSRKCFLKYKSSMNPNTFQLKCQTYAKKQFFEENCRKSVTNFATMQKSGKKIIVDQTKKCVESSHEIDTQSQKSITGCIITTKDIRGRVTIHDFVENVNDDSYKVQRVKHLSGLENSSNIDEQTTTIAMNHQDGEAFNNSLTNFGPYRNVIPSDAPSLPHDTWLHGGNLGNKNAVLVFRSSALANATDSSVQSKPGHKLHITYRVVQAETRLLSKLLECHGIMEASQNSNDFNLLWTGSHPKPGVLRSMAPHQRVNHFPRSYELTRKDRLYKNIEKMQHAKGLKHFDFIPQTFLMPTEYKELCSTHHRVKGPWIVKPAASSRGRGIYIVESPNQVPLEEPVVVAKYISKPLLVKGHKCDLRLYVAVTSFDPLLVYIYEEGMVRFATVKYDTTHKQLWNPCMHLCNYSINKYHSDYVKSDDPSAENVGHKWTLSALLRHLKTLGKDTGFLMSQVEDLVVKAILACGNSVITACKMFVPNATNCFELYGFDILIDENLKPWLLEVNLSPSLGCDSPLDVRLKSAMLSDLLTLVGIPAIDPVLRPTASPTNSSKNLKMKLSNCRRVHSADGLSNTLPKKSGTSTTITNMALTADDMKMVKNAKTQFERRGGFVRIFPAVDSWAKYSQYLEPLTGIPIAGSNSSLPFTMMAQHNFNQILYTQLFPDVPLVTPILRNDKLYVRHSLDRRRDASLDSVRKHDGTNSTARQDRYERKLVQGHRSSLTVPKKQLKESHSADLKRQISDMIKSGKRMSQVEARRAFSQYLTCVLKRISSSPDQEGHVEIVLKFLQKASTYLKSPFNVKIPSQKLSDKDRAAVVAKQLNDFLYLYNRETDFYGDMNSHIPKPVFTDFLEHARESDLEEVLILQNIHTVPNKGSQSTSSFQGLLRCLPNLTGSTCFRTPDTNKKGVKGVLNLKYMCEELGYYPHRVNRKWKRL